MRVCVARGAYATPPLQVRNGEDERDGIGPGDAAVWTGHELCETRGRQRRRHSTTRHETTRGETRRGDMAAAWDGTGRGMAQREEGCVKNCRKIGTDGGQVAAHLDDILTSVKGFGYRICTV